MTNGSSRIRKLFENYSCHRGYVSSVTTMQPQRSTRYLTIYNYFQLFISISQKNRAWKSSSFCSFRTIDRQPPNECTFTAIYGDGCESYPGYLRYQRYQYGNVQVAFANSPSITFDARFTACYRPPIQKGVAICFLSTFQSIHKLAQLSWKEQKMKHIKRR